MLLTSLVLVFLNFYSANTTRQLIYRAKAASLQDKAQLISSSFSGVDVLNTDNAAQIISVLGELNVERVIVTDAAGLAMYDSKTQQSAAGKQVLFREIMTALDGQDVLYCRYTDSALVSHGAMPIMQYGSIIGCVYVADVDPDQAGIIHALETNILKISFGVEAVLVLFSVVFAVTSSSKMRRILVSMQKAREGEYSHKIQMHGSDEYGRLAREFNRLTDRLQASELAQRQFVSDASHELKTPLASIKLLSDSILQNEMDAETMREFVGDIGSEADRLTRLTQKLLAISRAENTKQEHEVVDLSETIRKVFKMLVTLADEVRNLRNYLDLMKMRYEDDLTYEIHVDEALLDLRLPRLVLQPLAENCFDHGFRAVAPPWHIALRVFRDSGQWVIQLRDNGSGFDEEKQQQLESQIEKMTANLRESYTDLKIGGMGLANTIVRLRLTLDEEVVYSILPNEPRGSVVTLRGMLHDESSDCGG